MAAAEARRRSAVWALLPLLLRLLHPVALVLANTEGWHFLLNLSVADFSRHFMLLLHFCLPLSDAHLHLSRHHIVPQLIDWHEGGYLTVDLPMSRGEVVIGGPNVSSFLPTAVPLLQNTVKQKSFIGSSHLGSHAVLEYQFLPEQPSDAYERGSQLRFYDALAEVLNSRKEEQM
ncbi:hypothetical protein ZEAMMB73_Zm00001d043484 [Zea mays]|uniref:Uncharacterized protein n=1 Tax=Zea mays TaxID=4577 RepID=A0A1D6NCI3_MAIZE|nr:hypothetical protein ZEAMMB73_Zm00001d043484 [Zea mays]